MMADVEIFSDEFFGFAVPGYSPTRSEPDSYHDSVINSLSRLSVNDSDLTPTGYTRRPTSGPIEHEMPATEVNSEYSNTDTSIDAFANEIRYRESTSSDDEDHTSRPTHEPEEHDSTDSNIDTSNDVSGNDIDGCECAASDNENDEFEKLKSNIEFQLTRSHKENGGFSLSSSRSSGHMIYVEDNSNSHVQHMKLQTGDSIIGVKNVDVRQYDHHILVSILQHIYGEDSGVFKMVISRHVETGDEGRTDIRYIEINVRFEFPTRGESVLRMFVDVVTCTSLTFTKIICVKYKYSKVCWIRNNDQYLSIHDNQLTTSQPYTSPKDINFQFQWSMFYGLEGRTRGNTMCPSVFFCAFQSSASHTFITVQSGNRVGIGESSSLRHDISTLRKPDCRFFKPHLITENTYVLESLVHEGVYLCCRKRGLSMKGATVNLNDVFLIPRELKFDILTTSHALT